MTVYCNYRYKVDGSLIGNYAPFYHFSLLTTYIFQIAFITFTPASHLSSNLKDNKSKLATSAFFLL